jgi:segregation and condensation protein A
LADTFTIKLSVFEGPFDLLLFFIERDELDINNIPIAKITDDFLAYIRALQEMNIDLASEFIVVAATLMRIKAKMLIPRKQIDEEGNEIDPRAELVDRLMEYKQYKSTLDELRKMEELRAFMNPRGYAITEMNKLAVSALAEAEIESITLFKLMKVFQRVMLRFEDEKKVKKVHTVYDYDYTIQGQREFLFSQILEGDKIQFEAMFLTMSNRIEAVVTFLALLELLNEQLIALIQGEGINNFWLTLPAIEEEEEEAIESIT